ncbi:MAG: small ribosomal subunit Rsm22 family protein [Pseudobdellovibrionaceae bacterium]|jgi:ribosomal protein RSM22 (predicted rRNA methylase)|nr:small ribosomal subunit Rsm22 family protein [Pseudobdellovibrionaceae bacterium]
MAQQFPHALRARIEEAVQNSQFRDLISRSASDVSERYRRVSHTLGGSLQMKNLSEAMAYLVSRLPATFAANARVMEEVARLLPDFFPKKILDVGAGPATASLAAYMQWNAEQFTLLEPNKFLRLVGQDFIVPEISGEVSWIDKDLSGVSLFKDDAADLVLASYVLNEVGQKDWGKVIADLWSKCRGALIVVETGTPHGFSVVHAARESAAKLDGCHVIGPCPQTGVCPLAGDENRWCHFSVRVERSKYHKKMKDGAQLGYEDEKFSWVALSRFPATLPAYRVIGHPSLGKVIQLQVCGGDGVAKTLEVAKSSSHYKQARKCSWGDALYD